MMPRTIELPLELIELEEQNFHLVLKSELDDGKPPDLSPLKLVRL
ncbi:MAG: hypothetical protein AB7U05_13955 [Mangrovibacterium sp.]